MKIPHKVFGFKAIGPGSPWEEIQLMQRKRFSVMQTVGVKKRFAKISLA